MANMAALAGGIAAAAPGVAGGIQTMQNNQALQQQGNNAATAAVGQANADPAVQALQNDFSSPDHPAWTALNNMTAPGGTTGGAMGSALPVGTMQPNSGAVPGMQNGGLVRQNFGKAVVQPEFTKGPALPTGPNNTVTGHPTARGGMLSMENGGPVPGMDPTGRSTGLGQGITPAGTDGQVITMDAGGVVPSGFQQQPGITGVPMSGRGAALVEGLQAGQNLGHNLQQQWIENQNRTKNADNAYVVAGIDSNNPNSGNGPPSALQTAKDKVEGFFHTLHEHTLDDNHVPNQPAPGSPNASPMGATSPPPPGGGPAAIPGAPPAPAGAAPPAAGGTPPPAQQGAPQGPPAGAPPGAAPPQGTAAPKPGTAPGNSNPLQQSFTASAVQAAAGSQDAQQGIPSKTPEQSGLPHSITPQQWANITKAKQEAAQAAVRAGEDPQKVIESLDAMQNAHFQGQILKQTAAAARALESGDMDATKQALSNINYYLPNGQGITFKNANADDVAAAQKAGDTSVTAGTLMYKNPFHGMFGHENDPVYVPVTPMHISQLGAAALDPSKVGEAQMKQYSAMAEYQTNTIKAQGELATGKGRQLMGAAAYQKSNIAAQNADVSRRLDIASGNLRQAEANWYNVRQPADTSGRPKVTLAAVRDAQNDASNYVRNIVQGQPTTAPVLNADGTPNISPGAGKAIPNKDRIPPVYQGLNPAEQENTAILASHIAGANIGVAGMGKEKAADLAARITHYQAHPTDHMNPATHQKEPDFVYDGDKGYAHVWVGNRYENVYLNPNLADESRGGSNDERPPAIETGSNGGGGNDVTDNQNIMG